MQANGYIAVVEIPVGGNDRLPSELAKAAYEASRHGPVALLLPSEANCRLIDRELDKVVVNDRKVHGVAYRDIADPSVWSEVHRNTLVVGSSFDARRVARTTGAHCVDLAAGTPALRTLARAPR
jgi:hypothetical protein